MRQIQTFIMILHISTCYAQNIKFVDLFNPRIEIIIAPYRSSAIKLPIPGNIRRLHWNLVVSQQNANDEYDLNKSLFSTLSRLPNVLSQTVGTIGGLLNKKGLGLPCNLYIFDSVLLKNGNVLVDTLGEEYCEFFDIPKDFNRMGYKVFSVQKPYYQDLNVISRNGIFDPNIKNQTGFSTPMTTFIHNSYFGIENPNSVPVKITFEAVAEVSSKPELISNRVGNYKVMIPVGWTYNGYKIKNAEYARTIRIYFEEGNKIDYFLNSARRGIEDNLRKTDNASKFVFLPINYKKINGLNFTVLKCGAYYNGKYISIDQHITFYDNKTYVITSEYSTNDSPNIISDIREIIASFKREH